MTSPAADRAIARPPIRKMPRVWGAVVGVAVVFALIVVAWLLVNLQAAAVFMAIPALVPLGLVLTAVWWLDRWEPEPRILLALALLYGAGASVVGTYITGNFMLDVASRYLSTQGQVDSFSVLVQGPVTEELVKGIGLLLIVLIARREFNGPVDGFIYAAMIGAGFAFTENIIYFANSGGTGLAFVWLLVVRGILSPFAHVLFTGLTGMALGWATRRGGALRLTGAFVAGLIGAVIAHAFWNGGSVIVLPLLGVDPSNPFGWIIFYAVVQVPVFLATAWLLLRLVDDDRARTAHRLSEYERAGWFTPGEVKMLVDWDTRVRALRWARGQGRQVHHALSSFIVEATRLAYARERASVNKRDPDRRVVEREHLEQVRYWRERLRTSTARGGAGVPARTAGRPDGAGGHAAHGTTDGSAGHQ